uniref:Uncharacterized protein n=1 Tax=Candidatus Kentrum eta TaxID=2126337 RepID=A0A450VD11_9GAMM|nr:MAG: hypothetical protein BECKH772A_GA0070896_101006 [Candidatus Kentron sp. H]VFJ96983.1 MAG: hypothetical protein BECKH772B_GA0070898_101026 [Candidatus Kentron sp. H]VFK02657.1 MAG: hypothetical protein BECKH772C_GA0070978_100986 [Candidatus Kentron sp. H]
MYNHNPFGKTIHRGFLIAFCLSVLIPGQMLADEHATDRTITASEWEPLTNTARDGYKIPGFHQDQAESKETILFPKDGSICVRSLRWMPST